MRLSGCNLKCEFCDTNHEPVIFDLTPEQVYNKIVPILRKNKSKFFVISGGEPLIQYNEIKELLYLLNNEFKYILINTNGTVNKPLFKNVYYNISPKINKEEIYKKYINEPNVYFKFLIENKQDMYELTDFIEKYGYPKNDIYVSPEWSKDKEVTQIILKEFQLGDKKELQDNYINLGVK